MKVFQANTKASSEAAARLRPHQGQENPPEDSPGIAVHHGRLLDFWRHILEVT